MWGLTLISSWAAFKTVMVEGFFVFFRSWLRSLNTACFRSFLLQVASEKIKVCIWKRNPRSSKKISYPAFYLQGQETNGFGRQTHDTSFNIQFSCSKMQLNAACMDPCDFPHRNSRNTRQITYMYCSKWLLNIERYKLLTLISFSWNNSHYSWKESLFRFCGLPL